MLAEPQGVKALNSSLKHDYHWNGTFMTTGNVPQSRFTAKMRHPAPTVSPGLERVIQEAFLQIVFKALVGTSSLFVIGEKVRKFVHKLSGVKNEIC